MNQELRMGVARRPPQRAGWTCAAVLLLPLLVPLPALADRWLALRLPPRTQSEWVIQDGRVNGVPTQVQQLESELGPEELLGFFSREWTGLGGLPKAGTQRGWRTLALQRDPLQVVLQVQPASGNSNGGGGSLALLSQMNLRDRQTDFVPAELPTLPSTRITQVTESHDGARRSRLVQLASDAGFDLTQQRLRAHWQRGGWRPTHDSAAGPTRTGNSAGNFAATATTRQWLASYDQANASLDVVMAQAPGSGQVLMTIHLLDTRP